MLNLWKKKDLNLIKEYPKKVVDNVDEVIQILNEHYGDDRNVSQDLGGYICILEDVQEAIYLKENIIKGLLPEYSDIVCTIEDDTYNSTLYLLSSDYSVTVISKNEITDELLR